MKRTQIYLDPEQHKFLETMAFYLSQKQNRKITMSEVIRQAIDSMRENFPGIENETDEIIKSSLLMQGIKNAKDNDELYDHEKVFG